MTQLAPYNEAGNYVGKSSGNSIKNQLDKYRENFNHSGVTLNFEENSAISDINGDLNEITDILGGKVKRDWFRRLNLFEGKMDEMKNSLKDSYDKGYITEDKVQEVLGQINDVLSITTKENSYFRNRFHYENKSNAHKKLCETGNFFEKYSLDNKVEEVYESQPLVDSVDVSPGYREGLVSKMIVKDNPKRNRGFVKSFEARPSEIFDYISPKQKEDKKIDGVNSVDQEYFSKSREDQIRGIQDNLMLFNPNNKNLRKRGYDYGPRVKGNWFTDMIKTKEKNLQEWPSNIARFFKITNRKVKNKFWDFWDNLKDSMEVKEKGNIIPYVLRNY